MMSKRTPCPAAVVVLSMAVVAAPAGAQVAIHGEIVYTMAGPPVREGVVLIGSDGKIERVGVASDVRIPDGYRALQAKVVTPGLIDAHSVVGLAGYLNQPHDQMQLESSSAIQPELRAVDAYNAREPLVAWLRQHGVTVVHTGHAPGALVPGQTLIAKTRGDAVEGAVMIPFAAVAATLGTAGLAAQGKSPGNRSKAIAMLRAELIKANDYVTKQSGPADKRPARDLRLEAIGMLVNKQVPLLVTAHRAHDILTALRVAKEFDLRIILDGASEAYLVADRIKAAGVPVILHATMQRQGGDTENMSMETAAALRRAGIAVAIQSGYEAYVPKTRVVLFEAAVAAANGLTFEEALRTITLDAAKILGIDKRVGSLERGKDGDVALYDGDPFEYTSHVTAVVIDGVVVSDTPN
jgi:imidazolonepropionase-like amidohydrolase